MIKNKVGVHSKRSGNGLQTIKRKKERESWQKDGGSVRIETAGRRTREERGREVCVWGGVGGELSVGHRRECVAC